MMFERNRRRGRGRRRRRENDSVEEMRSYELIWGILKGFHEVQKGRKGRWDDLGIFEGKPTGATSPNRAHVIH
jgi:hypothetical protein